MSWKRSLLFRSEVLGVLGNTLTGDHIYCRHYFRQIFESAIITKPENVFWIFFTFSESTQNFAQFEKKYHLHSSNISEVIDSEKCGYLNAWKLLFQNSFRESTFSWVLNTADTTMPGLLSELFIDPTDIQLGKISVGEICNLKTVR